ncbi:uncharacterized protein M421DRAFT_73793 [Didymella exigua CBS 183.55]|uniref:EBP-domain-containing protein n=1 Tax=Didymella exigua CBS 183.55 TaxID=1150837 RepID=A0A6A5R9Y0_9PLEO|nr:uncharacterized protein M421DRAFT_73793 [Didymella exigua CBS 183.55]KAF1924008.1 hypothetical protein M421DRAFT_73793 [Didymella exigua CBS 183.55]
MVATRQHPRGDFPAFEPSPTKRPSRNSTASPAPTSPTTATQAAASNVSPTAKTVARQSASKAVEAVAPPSPSEVNEKAWCHTASNITILWLAVSLPLVLWDTLYILLRPHTMAGGALQWPIWKPYEIYAAIDYVYGWPGWENNDGFGGAQGALNAVETVLYGLYVMVIYYHSVPAATGTGLDVQSGGIGTWLSGGRKVPGRNGNRALLIGFTAAVMTLSKTVLYYFNEYFSKFENVAHNDWFTIFLFYGVMNGLWVIFPAYMTIVFGSDILCALDHAAEVREKEE